MLTYHPLKTFLPEKPLVALAYCLLQSTQYAVLIHVKCKFALQTLPFGGDRSGHTAFCQASAAMNECFQKGNAYLGQNQGADIVGSLCTLLVRA
ncbi:MAG: hypothetical protein HRT78_12665 [Halomonas sp.]|nr:hypothetical protein [Halomonas sp.]NQY77942.1 hypothetical protein [Halomonas sp.]